MAPNKQEGLIFENSCNCKFDPKILELAMLWWADGQILRKNRKVYMHGHYPAVSIFNEKLHIHRLIFSYNHRKKLIKSVHVHHKDHDKLNSLIDNLAESKDSAHASHHNKGKVLTQSHKDKIALANKRRKGIKLKKRVQMPDLEILIERGWSINKIAKYYNCNWSTVKNRIHENPELLEGSE